MSAVEGVFYLILLLLTPLALIFLMVLGVVKLTEADKRRFQRKQAIQQTSAASAWRQLVLGWWMALLGVILVFIMLKQFTITEPVLVLTTTYIEYAKWPFRRIPWHDITHCQSRIIVGKGVVATYLCLELVDQDKYLQRMGWLSRKVNRLNWLVGCSAIHVALTPLKVDSAEVVKLIERQIRPRSTDAT